MQLVGAKKMAKDRHRGSALVAFGGRFGDGDKEARVQKEQM